MVTRVTRSEMPVFKVKNKSHLWLLDDYSLVTRYKQTFPSTSTEKICVLHRMRFIGHVYSSQLMQWHNLGIVTLKHTIFPPNVF